MPFLLVICRSVDWVLFLVLFYQFFLLHFTTFYNISKSRSVARGKK